MKQSAAKSAIDYALAILPIAIGAFIFYRAGGGHIVVGQRMASNLLLAALFCLAGPAVMDLLVTHALRGQSIDASDLPIGTYEIIPWENSGNTSDCERIVHVAEIRSRKRYNMLLPKDRKIEYRFAVRTDGVIAPISRPVR